MIQLLLRDAIDYAGLFPPAQLDMGGAVAEYASYLESPERWALGRFVVPVSRLGELAAEGESLSVPGPSALAAAPWRLSVLVGNDVQGDLAHVRGFARSQAESDGGWAARVEALELKAATPDQVVTVARAAGAELERFVEIPIATDPEPLVRAIGDAGLYAKVRTGGVTADAFPTPVQLARFLAACVAHGVRFKATAGLHHPLRGDYAFTYEDGSARGTMFGFLNVFLATGLLQNGASEETAAALLDERDARAVQFDHQGAMWRGHRIESDRLEALRATGIASFGSCSFREPIDDLELLGML